MALNTTDTKMIHRRVQSTYTLGETLANIKWEIADMEARYATACEQNTANRFVLYHNMLWKKYALKHLEAAGYAMLRLKEEPYEEKDA